MALQDYAGALVVVSHDRHLIRSIADDLWMVDAGLVTPFDGDLDDYARALLESRSTRAGEERDEPTPAERRREQKRAEAEHRNRLSPLRSELRTIEEEIVRLERAQNEIERALCDPATYEAPARQALADTLSRQREVRSRLEVLESRWLEVSEILQSAERVS
jgi:ATP-binding cassette subfamily F protein 3